MQQIRHQSDLWEYADAFGAVRRAKNVLWTVVGLALVAQVACFAAVDFGGALDARHSRSAATRPATTQPTTELARAILWERSLRGVTRGTQIVAVAASLLLAATLTLAVLIALLGRLGGVAGFVGALFWAMLLAALVMPWQRVFNTLHVFGAVYDLEELLRRAALARASWAQGTPPVAERVLYYVRFIALPGVTLLVWLMAQVRFARGYRRLNLAAPERAEQGEQPGREEESRPV